MSGVLRAAVVTMIAAGGASCARGSPIAAGAKNVAVDSVTCFQAKRTAISQIRRTSGSGRNAHVA